MNVSAELGFELDTAPVYLEEGSQACIGTQIIQEGNL